MNILKIINKPYKIFADVNLIEYDALSQFVETMKQPSVLRGALMPDVHKGYTVPIGCVFETRGIIFPQAVGYDIGCGVCAVPTDFHKSDIKHKGVKIRNQILRNIPVGFNKREKPVYEYLEVDLNNITPDMRNIYSEKNGHLQLGTLGGGNHFIEVGYDEQETIWIIIHSGSRGVGHGCAQFYMKAASPTGKASEGHFGLDTTSDIGKNYIKDMNFCLKYALLNRKVMLRSVNDSIRQCGLEGSTNMEFMINSNHNHAESQDGIHWIHRKGATHAEDGMLGVVPGNSADGSFIVCGKGDEESLNSSSHGAGRVLGRRKAKEVLDLNEYKSRMKHVIGNVSQNTLDESPMAYKNIFEVMEQQKDLIDVEHYVKPIISVKG